MAGVARDELDGRTGPGRGVPNLRKAQARATNYGEATGYGYQLRVEVESLKASQVR